MFLTLQWYPAYVSNSNFVRCRTSEGGELEWMVWISPQVNDVSAGFSSRLLLWAWKQFRYWVAKSSSFPVLAVCGWNVQSPNHRGGVWLSR